MSGLVGIDTMYDFMRALAAETKGYLDVIERQLREFGPGLPLSSRAALELGVESYRTTFRWAKITLAELKRLRTEQGE